MLSRRCLIAGSTVSLAAFAATGASARAPLAGRQVAGAYRIKVGSIEVTALSDGFVGLNTQVFQGDQAELKRMLAAVGQTESLPTSVNAFLVNTGTRTILVDAGAGSNAAFGNTLGRMRDNLLAAGVQPNQIDTVVLTHAHVDHAEGLLNPKGAARFANAELVLHEAESAFWFDDAILARAPNEAKPFFASARKSLAPYAKRTRQVKGGEIAPGVTMEAAPGHTPGHCIVRVSSGKEQLLIVGDILHNVTIHAARPEIGFVFDTDAAQAVASRKRVFEMIAADQTLIAGAHIPFPGFGRILRDGAAYRYVPADWKAVL